MVDGMKCDCGKLMLVAEALSYGGRCEECWLRGQQVDMRGSFKEGDERPKGKGNKGHSPSPKVWPQPIRGRRPSVRDI